MKKIASFLAICAISIFAVGCNKSSTGPADAGSDNGDMSADGSQNGGAESGSTEGY